MDQRDADSDREFPVDGVGVRAGRLAAELREQARVIAAAQARELRLIAELAAEVGAAARAELPQGPRVPGQPFDEELISDAIDAELAAVLGISEGWAAHLSSLAGRLCETLPDTLAALQAGRLDLIRARRLADATADLPNEVARRVERQVLARCGEAPWEGPSPRAWRARIDRAVARLAPDYVRERRQRALAEREVRAWAEPDGTGVLRITGDQVDVAMADEVITDLALQWPDVDPLDPEGRKLSMGQRRVDSLMDLFRRVRDGRDLPALPVRREHDIGLVVSADTYFAGASPATPPAPDPGPGDDVRPGSRAGDDRADAEDAGDRAPAPGELRGLGAKSYLDPVSAGELARRQVALGAATTVLLTTAAGAGRHGAAARPQRRDLDPGHTQHGDLPAAAETRSTAAGHRPVRADRQTGRVRAGTQPAVHRL